MVKNPAPQGIGIDYINETLTGFEEGKTYKITVANTDIPPYEGKPKKNQIGILQDWFGKKIKIERVDTGIFGSVAAPQELPLESMPYVLTIPDRSLGVDLSTVPVTYPGDKNGVLVVRNQAQTEKRVYYRRSGSSDDWKLFGVIPAHEMMSVRGLGAGSYDVRCDAVKDVSFASETTWIPVAIKHGVQQQSQQIICEKGDMVQLRVNATAEPGDEVMYQWYKSAAAGEEGISCGSHGYVDGILNVDTTIEGVSYYYVDVIWERDGKEIQRYRTTFPMSVEVRPIPAPTPGIDYRNETLTGLEAGAFYRMFHEEMCENVVVGGEEGVATVGPDVVVGDNAKIGPNAMVRDNVEGGEVVC